MLTTRIVLARSIRLPIKNKVTSFYHHGFQSWSLAAWIPVEQKLPTPLPHLLHPMQFHPSTIEEYPFTGHWVGAVRDIKGNVTLLAGLALDCTVSLRRNELVAKVHTTGDEKIEWFQASGTEEEVFEALQAALLQKHHFFRTHPLTPQRVWCSWYSFYTKITETTLKQTLTDVLELPFEVVQIDDGWQTDIGDWFENEKFPSGLGTFVRQIETAGKTAGLWLAPLIASESSALFHEHPQWFVKDLEGEPISAGFNWGKQLYALDLTHPQAIAWLSETLQRFESLGFRYLKLDFLYAGALPGVRHQTMCGEQAYRDGLRQALSVLNPDTFVLFCGAPILPSLGLCHGLRIGPDVASEWESLRDATLLANPATPGVKNAIRTSTNRLWLEPFTRIDPDVAYFASADHHLSPDQQQALIRLAIRCGFKATSDIPDHLTSAERQALIEFLESSAAGDPLPIQPTTLAMPNTPLVAHVLRWLLGWISELPSTHRFLKRMADRSEYRP